MRTVFPGQSFYSCPRKDPGGTHLQLGSPTIPSLTTMPQTVPLLPPGGGHSGSDGDPEGAELLPGALPRSQKRFFVSWLSLLRSLDFFYNHSLLPQPPRGHLPLSAATAHATDRVTAAPVRPPLAGSTAGAVQDVSVWFAPGSSAAKAQHEQPSAAKALSGTVSHQPPKACGPKRPKRCPDTPNPGQEPRQGHGKATSLRERAPGRSGGSGAEELRRGAARSPEHHAGQRRGACMRAERGHSPLTSPPLSLQEAPGQELAQRSPGAASARTYPAGPATSSRPGPPSRRPPPASRQTNPPALRRHWLPAGGGRLRPLAGSAARSRPPFRHLGGGGGGGPPCWGGRSASIEEAGSRRMGRWGAMG